LDHIFDNTYHSFNNTVTHLNDDHRWTREQIADWVATIEQAEDVALTPHGGAPVTVEA
jgi:hypothetical protein